MTQVGHKNSTALPRHVTIALGDWGHDAAVHAHGGYVMCQLHIVVESHFVESGGIELIVIVFAGAVEFLVEIFRRG